ncbi:MAG: serine hydrolase, partial [Patescibacteria group bacterium]
MQRYLLIFIILILAAVSLIVKVGGVEQLVSDNIIRLATTSEIPAESVLNSANLNANISGKLAVYDCYISYGAKAVLTGELDKPALFEFNSDNHWPIASLTKLMASLIALENFPLNKEVQITEKAVSAEGQAADFKQGEIFTVRDLIKAMIVVSSNDAASALAEAF